MIRRIETRNGSWIVTMSNRIAVISAAAALLVATAVCPAGDAEGGAAGSDKPNIALNQGVSIEQIVPETDADHGSSTKGTLRSDEAASHAGAQEFRDHGQRKLKGRIPSGVHFGKNARLAREGLGLSDKQSTPSYLSGLGALAIVLVLIGVVAWAVKRWMPAARGGSSGVLRIVGRASLSAKHTVALVQLGRRFVMVGVTGDRLAALCEVSDPDEVAELVARIDTSGKHAAPGFDHMLEGETHCYREVAVDDAGGGIGAAGENDQDARCGYTTRGGEALTGSQREPVKDGATGTGPRKPLRDLLHRLRTLQIN